MKKDIEWLKEAVGELNLVDTVFEADGVSYIDTAVSVMQVYDLIDQLDEPEVLSQELPVIPKYVADWIAKHRDTFDLYPMLKRLEKNSSKLELTYKWYRTNTHEFVNAYLTGEYGVEEEPLYYALVKGHELSIDVFKYWSCADYSMEHLFIGSEYPKDKCINRMTKNNWNELGINDSNADFVEVKEMEE